LEKKITTAVNDQSGTPINNNLSEKPLQRAEGQACRSFFNSVPAKLNHKSMT